MDPISWINQNHSLGGGDSAPNWTDGELWKMKVPVKRFQDQIDGMRDLWMWIHERICNYPRMQSKHQFSDYDYVLDDQDAFTDDSNKRRNSVGWVVWFHWQTLWLLQSGDRSYYYTTLRRRKILRRELLRDFFQNRHFYGMTSKHPPTPGGATLLRKNDDSQEFP